MSGPEVSDKAVQSHRKNRDTVKVELLGTSQKTLNCFLPQFSHHHTIYGHGVHSRIKKKVTAHAHMHKLLCCINGTHSKTACQTSQFQCSFYIMSSGLTPLPRIKKCHLNPTPALVILVKFSHNLYLRVLLCHTSGSTRRLDEGRINRVMFSFFCNKSHKLTRDKRGLQTTFSQES